MTALFMQCEYNGAYHIVPQYGFTEFIPSGEEKLFGIVSTGFINLGTPLIRYRTGDYAILGEEKECACKRQFPKTVESVIGRAGDLIITPSGKIIQPNHLEYAIRHITHFKDCQIIQDKADHLRVLIIPEDGYTPEEGENFKKAILWRINEDIGIEIELVDKIHRPANIKKRFTINLLREMAG